jgi:fructose-bisphosphate aldolase, class I
VTQSQLTPIFLPSGGLTVAMDHGLDGVPAGFEDVRAVIETVRTSAPDAVIVTSGMARAWGERFVPAGIAMIGAVDAAISYGGRVVGHAKVTSAATYSDLGCAATKVVFQLGWSGAEFCEEITRIAGLVEESHAAGLPCIVEPNVIGGDGHFLVNDRQRVLDGCRISSELGADALKMPMLGTEGIAAARETSHCPVAVMGGSATDVEAFLADVRSSLEGGAVGVMAGRNVWQGGDAAGMVDKLRKVLAPYAAGAGA